MAVAEVARACWLWVVSQDPKTPFNPERPEPDAAVFGLHPPREVSEEGG